MPPRLFYCSFRSGFILFHRVVWLKSRSLVSPFESISLTIIAELMFVPLSSIVRYLKKWPHIGGFTGCIEMSPPKHQIIPSILCRLTKQQICIGMVDRCWSIALIGHWPWLPILWGCTAQFSCPHLFYVQLTSQPGRMPHGICEMDNCDSVKVWMKSCESHSYLRSVAAAKLQLVQLAAYIRSERQSWSDHSIFVAYIFPSIRTYICNKPSTFISLIS